MGHGEVLLSTCRTLGVLVGHRWTLVGCLLDTWEMVVRMGTYWCEGYMLSGCGIRGHL